MEVAVGTVVGIGVFVGITVGKGEGTTVGVGKGVFVGRGVPVGKGVFVGNVGFMVGATEGTAVGDGAMIGIIVAVTEGVAVVIVVTAVTVGLSRVGRTDSFSCEGWGDDKVVVGTDVTTTELGIKGMPTSASFSDSGVKIFVGVIRR